MTARRFPPAGPAGSRPLPAEAWPHPRARRPRRPAPRPPPPRAPRRPATTRPRARPNGRSGPRRAATHRRPPPSRGRSSLFSPVACLDVLVVELPDAVENRARQPVLEGGILEALLLLGTGDEGDLDQDGRHGRAHQDAERRLLDAAVGDVQGV